MSDLDKLKVVLIDPWGTANTSEYLNGLIRGLSVRTELTVFTNKYFEEKTEYPCNINKIFFEYSERMNVSKKRKIIRGLEYIASYAKIIFFLKKNKQDVVHINWLLFYPLDVYLIRILKRMAKKLVYTAHNVIPHSNGECFVPILTKIYKVPDVIILHGSDLVGEFKNYFGEELTRKIYIQKHGCNIDPENKLSDENNNDNGEIIELRKKYSKIFIFFGAVFYNKGVDRLLKIWRKVPSDDLLIVAGKRNGEYPELDKQILDLGEYSNITYIDEYLPDDILNRYIEISDMIVLPYRHASMSGVIFTAADFAKTVLVTNVGCIPEYLENGVDSLICDNDDKSLENAVISVINNIGVEKLQEMGTHLQCNIRHKCGWDNICEKLIKDCYLGA